MPIAVLLGVIVAASLIGMLPGRTSTMGAALLIRQTLRLPPESRLALLGGIYLASTFSGSISAISAEHPGTVGGGDSVRTAIR